MLKSVFQIEDMTTTCIPDIRKKVSEVDEYVKLISAEILDKSEKNMDEATKALKVLSIQATKLNDIQFHTNEIPAMISEQTKALQSILVNSNQPIHRLASQHFIIDDHLREEDRLKIFSWLSEAKYLNHHRSKSKELMPGSGQWLIEKDEFKEWMNSSASSILWLHGIPGPGKSILIAHVIEYLLNHRNEEKHSVSLAYFYCARNSHEPERSDPTEIMRSFLEQLSCGDEEEPIKFPVVAAYKQRREEAKGRKPEQLSLDECTKIILELLDTEPAIIVIDGLDECDPKKRQGFLDALRTIIKDSNNVFKVFVSSRDDHDIVHRLSETPNLYIQASDNAEDISRFIVSRVEEAILKERILCGYVSLALKRQIIQALLGKSNWMFRLPSLHMDSLCDPDRIKTEATSLTP